jgi:hypothetical protein
MNCWIGIGHAKCVLDVSQQKSFAEKSSGFGRRIDRIGVAGEGETCSNDPIGAHVPPVSAAKAPYCQVGDYVQRARKGICFAEDIARLPTAIDSQSQGSGAFYINNTVV